MDPPKSKKIKKAPPSSSQLTNPLHFPSDYDDDFQTPILSFPLTQSKIPKNSQKPLKSINNSNTQKLKTPKNSIFIAPNKENIPPIHAQSQFSNTHDLDLGLDFIGSSIDCTSVGYDSGGVIVNGGNEREVKSKEGVFMRCGSNSIESRLLKSGAKDYGVGVCENVRERDVGDSEEECGIDMLLKLCSEVDDLGDQCNVTEVCDDLIQCPLCGFDISGLSDELRQVHTNECLDKGNGSSNLALPNDNVGNHCHHCPGQVLNDSPTRSSRQAVDVSSVVEWLGGLGLAKYEENFVREEIDWESLQWLTDEDLFGIGVTALGPRKKIIHALGELRKVGSRKIPTHVEEVSTHVEDSISVDDAAKLAANKLITDYFRGPAADHKRKSTNIPKGQTSVEKSRTGSRHGRHAVTNHIKKGKLRDIPIWCSIPGTPFRVDAFKYLRRDCSHWFLTHFHLDHYQGLTKSFCHGKIYCSSITAHLVNLKIGVPWDNLQVLPLNQKISIAGVDVTCFDANHCPGSVIVLFEPPCGKAILHTGDFRFDEEMTRVPFLQKRLIDTLILDTTYCDPQYDFPKQEAVIQYVIEVIQAEAFNPRTLFLIGSYTIGKERLFIEVARVLRKKIYVNAAKLRLLECLGLPKEDMEWFTLSEQESHIHVVPMWTLASFKRLKYVSNQYMGRYSLIVAFSPTGWTFGKGKKKSPGRRSQQGTIVRYEVPYSEHSSFTELQKFVKFVSPVNIIPSVNNDGPESTDKMISLLTS